MDIDIGALGAGIVNTVMMRVRMTGTKKWGLHIDHPWSECVREYGAPTRIYIRTPKVFITIALGRGNGTQAYDWKAKIYTDRYSWITFIPT